MSLMILQKTLMIGAGAVVLTGSSYGGYRILNDTDRTPVRNQAQESSASLSEEGVRGSRPDEAGSDGTVGDFGERADLVGRVSVVGDGYLDISVFADPGTAGVPGTPAASVVGQGTGAGQGRGGRNAGTTPSALPVPEESETIRVMLSDGTEYFLVSGGPDSESLSVGVTDVAEGNMVSVWISDSADGTIKTAKRITVREAGVQLSR